MLLMELLRSLYVTYQSSLLHEEMNRVHRTSDIDLTDRANTRRVARERSSAWAAKVYRRQSERERRFFQLSLIESAYYRVALL